MIKTRLTLFLLTGLALSLQGCKDLFDNTDSGDRYSLGTVKAILEEKGDFGKFLDALELTGYTRLVDGGGLVTVFAPDDRSFSSYLTAQYDTDDLDAVPLDELTVLVSYHLIQFSYNTDDFLAFSTESSDEGSETGDGSCYKYKTYAREPIKNFRDPLTGRTHTLFSREKFLPVISTKLFENRASPDPEKDYKAFFPEGNWTDADDRLYAGNAAVVESGIPTDNGYLYIIDAVSEPLPTIYDALGQDWAGDYSIYKKMFDRFNFYSYNASLSKTYAPAGDSLFLHFHYRAPQSSNDLPELASEWTYHNEYGSAIFENDLRFAVNCFAPKDDALKSFVMDYFNEYGVGQMGDDWLQALPDNHVYHLLRSHAFGLRDLIIPSELDIVPVAGPNGEKFEVSSAALSAVKFCTNGVIYGMDKVFIPYIFEGLTMPLFKFPKFTWFSLAFNKKAMYQMASDRNNPHTLFIVDDTDMALNNYTYSVSTTDFGSFQLLNNRNNMADNGIGNLVQRGFVYGIVPDPEENIEKGLRYFVSKNYASYFYMLDGTFKDSQHNMLEIRETYDTDNGKVYQVNRPFGAPTTGVFPRVNMANASSFKTLLQKTGLVANSSFQFIQTEIMFVPTNEAVDAAIAAGMIPEYDDADNGEALRQYLKYYFSPLHLSKLNHFLAPGLGPDGVTDEAFDIDLVTHVEFADEADARTVNFSWDPADPGVVTITDPSGHSISTDGSVPLIYNNGICYTIEECFDYRTMFGN